MASESVDGQVAASSSAKEEREIDLMKVQVENLKKNLQNVEFKLSEESAMRLKAESALDEFKGREKRLLELEHDGKALQEEVKWRNERFESLQEAHNRMRDQFHEGQSAWASEKVAMLRNIEVLTENAEEFERLQAVVNDVRECNTKAEHRILILEDRLRAAQKELEAKNNLSQNLLSVEEHEEVVLAMRSECEVLQRQLSTCDAERYEMEKERDKLLAESKEKKPRREDSFGSTEVEGRKDRASLPVGQRVNTKRQLEDFAKQVKSLNAELQKWKDIAAESSERWSKLQSSLESMQKENGDLREQLSERVKKASEHSATSQSDENRLMAEELEHLRTEVEKWRSVAGAAEGVKSRDSLGMFEDEMEVISRNPSGELLETSLQAEVEDWKRRVECATKEQEDMRLYYETAVKDLHEELEKKLKEFQVKSRDAAYYVAEERQRNALELAELQKELQSWKSRAADAAVECSSLREAHNNVMKELQLCKENAETAVAMGRSVKANLEKAVQDLENQVHVWKQKAEEALEGVTKTQEFEGMIKALDQERASAGLQLEKVLLEVEEKAVAAASDSQALKDEFDSAIAEKSAEIQQLGSIITGLKSELSELSELQGKADNDNSSQLLQLRSLLTETQSQLQEWQERATVAFQVEEELRHAIGEVKSQTEKLDDLIRALKDELLETQMELQDRKEEIAAFSSSTDSLKDELGRANELTSALTSELNTQKQNVLSLQKLNRQLECDLELVREEALSRKEWMTQILTQLEGSVSMSQRELQHKLHFAQHRLLRNESLKSKEAAAKAFPVGSDSSDDAVNCNSTLQTPVRSSLNQQGIKGQSPDFTADIFRGSSPAVDKLRQELSSLNSFVSKLEHARGGDGEQSLSLDGGEKMRDVVHLQEVTKVTKEMVPSQRNRFDSLNRSGGARLKVLAEVDANSLRAAANHDALLQPEAPCLPDNIPYPRLRCTASGV